MAIFAVGGSKHLDGISPHTRDRDRKATLLRPTRVVLLLVALAATPSFASAQSISGRLMDSDSDRPIPLGLVMMFTEAGDSITATISDEQGLFTIASDEPGDFVLVANALGYEERQAGVFELGAGGSISVEYRLDPAPLEIDRVLVELDRPIVMHQLVRNGFVSRFQRGQGLFVTPHDIENAVGRLTTESLLEDMPGVSVRTVNTGGMYRPELGEVVQIQSTQGWCTPTFYIDGIRTSYDPSWGLTVSSMVGRQEVEAIEVYRRPSEMPPEYSQGTGCGVIVVWSRSGPSVGQVPITRTPHVIGPDGMPRLPRVRHSGPPPVAGEQVRLDMTNAASQQTDLASPWEGEILMVQDDGVVVVDPLTRRAVAIPHDGVLALQVRREREPTFALYRAAGAGAAATLGVGFGLTLLCDWSDCNRDRDDQWGPAIGVGLLVGWAVHRRGPGFRWVEATLPSVGPAGDGVGLSWRLSTN